MNIAELKNDKIEYQVKVTVLAQDVDQQIESELVKIAKTARIDGFRVGKVPVSLLKRRYSSSLRADVAGEKIDTAIKDIIRDKNLNVAFDPVLSELVNEAGKDLEFTLKFELLPTITLPDFKKISLEKPVLEVSEKEIDEYLEQMANSTRVYDKEVKTKAKKYNQVTIDAEGYIDGKFFEGSKLVGAKLALGSGTFIPGFEDQLIGSKAGDDVVVKVVFPEDYYVEDLAGKPAEFKVKVLAVREGAEQKIDDEFAKKFKHENIAAFRENIAEDMRSVYQGTVHTFMKMKLFNKLEEMLDFDIPDSLLNREKATLKSQEDHLDEDLEINAMTEHEKEQYFTGLATRRVRIGLMLAEYVRQKGLKITPDDLRNSLMAIARNYPGQEQQVIAYYQKNPNAIESLKGPILEEKGVDAIFAQEVVLIEKSYTKDKLEELLKSEIQD